MYEIKFYHMKLESVQCCSYVNDMRSTVYVESFIVHEKLHQFMFYIAMLIDKKSVMKFTVYAMHAYKYTPYKNL